MATEHRKSLAEMCEGDVRPGGAVGLSLDPLMNGHDCPRPVLGRSESEITPDMRLPPEDEGAHVTQAAVLTVLWHKMVP